MYYSILPILIVVGVIVAIFYGIGSLRNKKGLSLQSDKDWHIRVALSKEDLVAQLFAVLSVFFLMISLLSINKIFGQPIALETLVLFCSIVAIFVCYYFKFIFLLPIGLFGLISWWSVKIFMWSDVFAQSPSSVAIFVGLPLIFLSFYLIGRIHEQKENMKRLSLVYVVLGVIFVTGQIFFYSNKFGLEILENAINASIFSSWQVAISILFLIILFLGLLIFTNIKKLIHPGEFGWLLLLFVLFVSVLLIQNQNISLFEMTRSGFYSSFELNNVGYFWAIIYNLAIFIQLIGIILLGYKRKEEWLINMGVIFLFILILIKYFDWFFDFIEKSIFFILAGILLFVVGWFMEKGRRKIISEVKSS
ncbi:MAG TPA: hypothetical protein PJ997_01360 [Candidatus Paceibacterota bacterium]|nr:hypothetical protein [Candidatus Paceibacterota bacterium]HMP18967.1 hypothetical protein [Candidatus Paceibacterota bacterium]HMP85480.1 hypothetical protein [Candidatus Paceibacterota bacterium]